MVVTVVLTVLCLGVVQRSWGRTPVSELATIVYNGEKMIRPSTAAALPLIFEMDSLRKFWPWYPLMRLSVPSGYWHLRGRYVYDIWENRPSHYYLSPRLISDFGWDHALSLVPGVLVR